MSDDELSPERAELLTLRARIVVAERAALAALEAMLSNASRATHRYSGVNPQGTGGRLP